jgi:hypothetical protein
VTGSGPKGRGFESRHFDQEKTPEFSRLPGFFLFTPRALLLWKYWGKLGENQARRKLKPLQINRIGLGELGEISTSCPV